MKMDMAYHARKFPGFRGNNHFLTRTIEKRTNNMQSSLLASTETQAGGQTQQDQDPWFFS